VGIWSTAGICLVIQIITGVFLAMHYTPHVDFAFLSVEHIMRDVTGGGYFVTCMLMVLACFLLWYIFIFFADYIMEVMLAQEN